MLHIGIIELGKVGVLNVSCNFFLSIVFMLCLLFFRVMIKRTQRPKRFMRNNMKKRHFRLTSCELSYSKSKSKRLLCSIPLADIVAADIVTEVNNLKMNNMFQIGKFAFYICMYVI